MRTTDVINQEDFSNAAITRLLDEQFPLRSGTHSEVKTYLVYFDHLMAIKTDGSTTSLVTPSQFQKADGSLDGPTVISLDSGETQAQIHLQTCHSSPDSQHPCINKVHLEMGLSA